MKSRISTILTRCARKGRFLWARMWMSLADLPVGGQMAMRFAGWAFPPYRGRVGLARMNRRGYIAPSATIYHKKLHLGHHVFIGDHVLIYQVHEDTGPVDIGSRVRLHREVIIETGAGGSLSIGAETNIQPRCQFSAYKGSIRIGTGVSIAPYCAFYPYDHSIAPDKPIRKQPLRSKGGIVIGDEAWLGVGVIVLDGVRIGKGAVIGAGSVVTRDIPDNAIAAGVPARVLSSRDEIPSQNGTVSGETKY